jgi:hypothetical protein
MTETPESESAHTPGWELDYLHLRLRDSLEQAQITQNAYHLAGPAAGPGELLDKVVKHLEWCAQQIGAAAGTAKQSASG